MARVAKRLLGLSLFVAVAFLLLSGRNTTDAAKTARPSMAPSANPTTVFPQLARNSAGPAGDRMSDFPESAKTVVSTSTRVGLNSAHQYLVAASEPTILFMFGATLLALSLALRSKRAN